MSRKDPEQIWNGLTDEEKIQFTNWVSQNVFAICFELSKNSVNMSVDRYDDLGIEIDEWVEDLDNGISRFQCECGEEYYEIKDMVSHLLTTHIDDILKDEY